MDTHLTATVSANCSARRRMTSRFILQIVASSPSIFSVWGASFLRPWHPPSRKKQENTTPLTVFTATDQNVTPFWEQRQPSLPPFTALGAPIERRHVGSVKRWRIAGSDALLHQSSTSSLCTGTLYEAGNSDTLRLYPHHLSVLGTVLLPVWCTLEDL